MYFRNWRNSSRDNFKPSVSPYRYFRNNFQYTKQPFYSWTSRSPAREQQYFKPYNFVSKVRPTLYSDRMLQRGNLRQNNYDNYFETKNFYVVRKPNYQLHCCRSFPGRSLYTWKCKAPTKEQLDQKIDSFISGFRTQRAWKCGNREVGSFRNRHYNMNLNSRNNKMKRNVSSFRHVRRFPYSQPIPYKWKRPVPTKKQLDKEIDDYMAEKFKGAWNTEHNCFSSEENSCENNSCHHRRKVTSPFRRDKYVGRSQSILNRRERELPSKQQLDAELEEYMLEVQLKNFSLNDENLNKCPEKSRFASDSEMSHNSEELQFPFIRNDVRPPRPYLLETPKCRPWNEEQRYGKRDNFSQTKYHRHRYSERNKHFSSRRHDDDSRRRHFGMIRPIVSYFRNRRRDIRDRRPAFYRSLTRIPTKEELDHELDTYMSEIKFVSPMNRVSDNVINDVDLFLEEYRNETMKSLDLQELSDFDKY